MLWLLIPEKVSAMSVEPWVWKAPMSGLGESSGSPRWSVVIGVVVPG